MCFYFILKELDDFTSLFDQTAVCKLSFTVSQYLLPTMLEK